MRVLLVVLLAGVVVGCAEPASETDAGVLAPEDDGGGIATDGGGRVDAGGADAAGADAALGPTSVRFEDGWPCVAREWAAGEIRDERHRYVLRLVNDGKPGEYSVRVRWLDADGGAIGIVSWYDFQNALIDNAALVDRTYPGTGSHTENMTFTIHSNRVGGEVETDFVHLPVPGPLEFARACAGADAGSLGFDAAW